MAKVYKINTKRYEFVDVDSATTSTYLISESDFNKWIKADTSTESIDIQMPEGMANGFRCIVENTGLFTVNYVNGSGTSLETQQDPFTEDQYRTVELVYESNKWRIQGYVGRNDISSLYDVNTDAEGIPEEGDVLEYRANSGIWTKGKKLSYIPRSPENLDFIIQKSDHGKIIPVNTDVAPVEVAINPGLPEGFYCRIQNVGTGVLNITSGVSLNTPTTSLSSKYSYLDIFHSGLESYYAITNEGGSIVNVKFNTQSTGTQPLTTPEAGESIFDTSTNELYIYNGNAWVGTTLN